ncbi:MAG TPA: EamA family transporter RarD [Dermatophilaceae bacterium]|nr:EamA family transporter RarD [Dermatophilaceae bacterium]
MTDTAPPGSAAPQVPGHDPNRAGTAYGLLAYGLWGLFPLYFHLLPPAGPLEILAHRILWTLLVCGGLIAAGRNLDWVRKVFNRPRNVALVTVASLVLALNWVVYVAAVAAHNVTEASLGYFLNPLVTVALGVVVLRERLRRLQWLAVGIGCVAALYLTVDFGRPPWVAITLALSFATYGLMKNRIGARLTAAQSLTSETLALAPMAVGILAVLAARGSTTFTSDAPWHPALLAISGPVTALPLLLFGAAARRVPLVTVGLLQFITPVLQLLCGVLLLGEHLGLSRWVGFGMVWLALVALTVDSVRSARSRSRPVPEPAGMPG